ncbi:MAG: altronate dehydratase family protein, partial [Clostridiales bacterium]|nr:altronate dehydratase family protein [Clostridiales bacterium]
MNTVLIKTGDNVVVAVSQIRAWESFVAAGAEITAINDIPMGHKIAIKDIHEGSGVIKYGYPIGHAISEIKAGMHVHTHNIKTGLLGEIKYNYEPKLTPPKPMPAGEFMGYRRENGKVGIRNEIWVIPTVGCVNSIGTIIAEKSQCYVKGGIDGIYCFTHPYGCSQLGQDHENTKRALAGLINHPNAGAVLVLGLGCENNGIKGLQDMLGFGDTGRVKFLVCQDVEDEIETALSLIKELAQYASGFSRVPVKMSELIVGLKCGGSDGFSGITANPLVGIFSDRVVAEGGTAILTEVPEMFGAETILMDRCLNKNIFDKTVEMINGFKEYFISHKQPVYENPSPGNKDGGITTLEDKSLGCIQKAGHATVTDILNYGESSEIKGLNLLNSPGND